MCASVTRSAAKRPATRDRAQWNELNERRPSRRSTLLAVQLLTAELPEMTDN